MNKFYLIIILFLFPLGIKATPQYISKLSVPKTEGFYIIHLPADIIGKTQANFSDLRIMNENGQEIPYFVKKDVYINQKKEFQAYPVTLLATTKNNKETHLIIETGGDTISSLVMNIKNADTRKTATLSGSNDTKEWFVVKEKLTLYENYAQKAPNTLLTIDFPVSDYQYYRLSINDSVTPPLNITEIGQINSEYHTRYNLQEIPTIPLITNRQDSTIVDISLSDRYIIRGIQLYVSGPMFYKRRVFVSTPIENQTRNKRNKKNNVFIKSYTLNSDIPGSLYLPWGYNSEKLRIAVSNDNNLPLCIDSAKIYSDKYFIVAYMPAAGNYKLTYGDPTIPMPDYDIAFFENKIPPTLQELSFLSTETIEDSPDKSSFRIFMERYGIWIIIVVVCLQILYSVLKMTKNKNEESSK